MAKPLSLTGETYTGYYNVLSGQTYSGRTYETGATELLYDEQYANIIDNAFGIRITPDGRIGYRTIYATDICYTGDTQDVSGITNNSFIDDSSDCDNFTIKKIITPYFTIEESYTRDSVITNELKNLLITATFERDFALDECDLTYGTYRNGTLSININGFTVYRNSNFKEVIPHELDTDKRLQEGVPFNLSFGGGTQGLYEAQFIDTGATISGILEKFFGGTFMGGVSLIEMYSVPLYITEIRKIIDNSLISYDLSRPKGGRRIILNATM